MKSGGRLHGQVAIVTGGASGIGKGMCLTFASEGAILGIADINARGAALLAKKIEKQGGQAMAMTVDVRDHQAVAEAVARAVKRYGRIDILVNCAGWSLFKNAEETTNDYWEKVRSINLDGAWYFSQAVMPVMMKHRKGKILNIGSAASIQGIPQAIPYTAAKHGLVGLTRALAVELGPYHVNVNCLCPAMVVTPQIRKLTTETFRRKEMKRYPLGRLGKISDVVRAAFFLVSSDADWITGIVLPVDGGLTSCIRVKNTF